MIAAIRAFHDIVFGPAAPELPALVRALDARAVEADVAQHVVVELQQGAAVVPTAHPQARGRQRRAQQVAEPGGDGGMGRCKGSVGDTRGHHALR